MIAMTKKQPFAARLQKVRELRGLTQAALARASGLEPAMLSRFEAGLHEPSMANLRRLCRALLVSADFLLGLSERAQP